jgi:hypothetical protein
MKYDNDRNRIGPILTLLFIVLILCIQVTTYAQQKDSTRAATVFSGSIAITSNGFSIIPSFSFNQPAAIVLASWKKNKFSFDPEFRVTGTGKKGSVILWFRYHAIQGRRFSLRAGVHPAANWFPYQITNNGNSEEWIRLRRFLAWELAPSFSIRKNWRASVYYLQGNGLQNNGPRTTHFVNFNSTISNIPISPTLRFTITPAVYYLNIDGKDGVFFTAAAALGHTRLPFQLQSAINQQIRSDIAGTQPFMWNVGVAYVFRKELR